MLPKFTRIVASSAGKRQEEATAAQISRKLAGHCHYVIDYRNLMLEHVSFTVSVIFRTSALA
jgi:hypothetical protein